MPKPLQLSETRQLSPIQRPADRRSPRRGFFRNRQSAATAVSRAFTDFPRLHPRVVRLEVPTQPAPPRPLLTRPRRGQLHGAGNSAELPGSAELIQFVRVHSLL